MQALSNLLRKLAVITQHVSAMRNQQVAYILADQLKKAAKFSSIDYVDIADTVADYLSEATPEDFCPEDIQRLHVIGITLRQAHTYLHKVQNQTLAAQ